MPVTSGTTSGSSMGGNKTTSNPSGGGPGGGSLSAPARTAPSTGTTPSSTGGQKGSTTPSKGSTTPSKAASAPSTAAGKTDKGGATTSPSNPTGGSLSAPARTAPSSAPSKAPSGTGGSNSTGGGLTPRGNPTGGSISAPARTAPSAKVTDPSRGASPMSGQGTSYSTPKDAKKANDQYADTYGFYNRVTKNSPTAINDVYDIRGKMGPHKGPGVGDFEGWEREWNGNIFNPNSPLTRQQNDQYQRSIKDEADSYYRGLKGVEMDDDLRTPQEVREAVQRRMDYDNGLIGQHVRDSWRQGITGSSPDEKLNTFNGRMAASDAVPNISLDPSLRAMPERTLSRRDRGIIGNTESSWSQSTTAPGRTDRQTPQTTAPGRTDRQTPQTTAPGRTDRAPSPTVARPTSGSLVGSGTSTAWGGPNVQTTAPGRTDRTTPQTTAPGRDDRQTPQTTAPGRADRQTPQTVALGREDRQTPQTVAPGRTDRAPSPSVARPSGGSYIDSLEINGPLTGMQPTAPSIGQVIARDPMDYTGPRIGTAPYASAPPARTMTTDPVGQALQAQMVAERIRAAQTAAPPKIEARVPGLTRSIGDSLNPSTPPTTPAMPDPRASLQREFERIKMARGQVAQAPQTTAPGRTDAVTPQTTAPGRTDQQAPSVATGPQPEMSPEDVLPQPTTPTRTASLNYGFPNFDPSSPNQMGAIDAGLINSIQMAAGIDPTVHITPDIAQTQPAAPASGVDRSISPSQGDYPPDENPAQGNGQPQSLAELANRYNYEKAQAKQGITRLPGQLFNAITSGDIRGYTPQLNDKRGVTPPSQGQRVQPPPTTNNEEAAAVARLMALLKLIEQGGTSNAQADLVNSTFI